MLIVCSHSRLPRWLSGKEPACQCRGHKFNPWVRKTPWRRKWQPTPVFLPGESLGRRSLVGYSPWGHEESDTPERLHFHFSHILQPQKMLIQKAKVLNSEGIITNINNQPMAQLASCRLAIVALNNSQNLHTDP